jgi:hypothetical protein
VKNTEKYKLQYPLNVQVFGPFRSRLCLLYDKIRDNATLAMENLKLQARNNMRLHKQEMFKNALFGGDWRWESRPFGLS